MKIAIIILIIVLILAVIALLAVGHFAFMMMLRRGGSAKMSQRLKKQNQSPFELDFSWLEHSGYQEIYQQSYDGLRLHAYVIDRGSPRWVVICHTYTGNAKCMSTLAAEYDKRGYSILMPNSRAHGRSQDNIIGMGWPEHYDLLGWLDKLNTEYAPEEIVLHGVSMGGTIVAMTLGETDKLPGNVVCAIEDCGYSSVWEEFGFMCREYYKLPITPVMYAFAFWNRVYNHYNLRRDGDALKQVQKCRTPMLFFHGDDDHMIPYWMTEKLYAAATCPKEKVIIHGADHGKSSSVAPELYWQTVDAFLAKYLKD